MCPKRRTHTHLAVGPSRQPSQHTEMKKGAVCGCVYGCLWCLETKKRKKKRIDKRDKTISRAKWLSDRYIAKPMNLSNASFQEDPANQMEVQGTNIPSISEHLGNSRFTKKTSTNLGRPNRLPHVCTKMIKNGVWQIAGFRSIA